jgi:HEAT repeat protein
MTRACGAGDERRKAFAAALTEAIGKERPAEPTSFLIRQLQLCADADAIPALAKYLSNDELAAPALAAMEAIGAASAGALRQALPASKGRTRLGVILALGNLRDTAAADAIRPLIGDKDAEVRLAAAWAAARIGDVAAVGPLIKAPLGQGYDRTKLNTACFLLAENLAKAGKKDEAVRLYRHVQETRNDKNEAYVRDAAERGLAAALR